MDFLLFVVILLLLFGGGEPGRAAAIGNSQAASYQSNRLRHHRNSAECALKSCWNVLAK